MQSRKKRNIIFGITAVLVAVIGFAGCKTFETMGVVTPPATISGAKYIGMETCAVCHERQVKDFSKTEHARLVVSNENIKDQGCEACHGQGSLHADAKTKKEIKATIVNPGKDPEACYTCHLEKKGSFSLQYHHPVPEGRVSCTDCHDPHSPGVKPGSATSIDSINEVCAKCHKDQAGPFVYEHEALREGCTVCHDVHGSINDKMLKARDSNLCLRCHYQTTYPTIGNQGHGTFIPRGPCFSGGCHTAPHGSNYNEHLRI